MAKISFAIGIIEAIYDDDTSLIRIIFDKYIYYRGKIVGIGQIYILLDNIPLLCIHTYNFILI